MGFHVPGQRCQIACRPWQKNHLLFGPKKQQQGQQVSAMHEFGHHLLIVGDLTKNWCPNPSFTPLACYILVCIITSNYFQMCTDLAFAICRDETTAHVRPKVPARSTIEMTASAMKPARYIRVSCSSCSRSWTRLVIWMMIRNVQSKCSDIVLIAVLSNKHS